MLLQIVTTTIEIKFHAWNQFVSEIIYYLFIGYIPEAPLIKKGNSVNPAELKRFIQYSAYDFIMRELDMDTPLKFRLPDGRIVNFIIRVRFFD